MSRSFANLARLSFQNFRDITNEFPIFKRNLKQWIYQYNDPKKKFLERVIKKIFYFKEGLSRDNKHDIYYGLQQKQYENKQVIIKEYSNANCLLIVENGLVEVYTECEGNEFIIDKLYPGSIINYRAYFMEDLNYVNMRACGKTNILELHRDTLSKVQADNKEFNKKINLY